MTNSESDNIMNAYEIDYSSDNPCWYAATSIAAAVRRFFADHGEDIVEEGHKLTVHKLEPTDSCDDFMWEDGRRGPVTVAELLHANGGSGGLLLFDGHYC